MAHYTVLTPPVNIAMTTLAVVNGELELTTGDNPSRDTWLTDRIDDASEAVQDEIDQVLNRQRVSERFDGTGRTTAVLEVAPVVALEKLSNWALGDIDLTIQTLGQEYARVQDPGAGIIWCRLGFSDDAPVQVYLTPNPMPSMPGAQPWEATYVAGYLTRADDIAASGIAASASGSTLVMPAGEMPMLVPADQVRFRGWAHNRGRYIVVAAASGVITLDGVLADETAGAGAVLEVRTLPSALERAVIDTVKAWYFKRSRDMGVTQESLADWSASYGTPGVGQDQTSVLPPTVLNTLAAYRRLM